ESPDGVLRRKDPFRRARAESPIPACVPKPVESGRFLLQRRARHMPQATGGRDIEPQETWQLLRLCVHWPHDLPKITGNSPILFLPKFRGSGKGVEVWDLRIASPSSFLFIVNWKQFQLHIHRWFAVLKPPPKIRVNAP